MHLCIITKSQANKKIVEIDEAFTVYSNSYEVLLLINYARAGWIFFSLHMFREKKWNKFHLKHWNTKQICSKSKHVLVLQFQIKGKIPKKKQTITKLFHLSFIKCLKIYVVWINFLFFCNISNHFNTTKQHMHVIWYSCIN